MRFNGGVFYIQFIQMSTYIFILGKHPDLSIAELKTRYPKADVRRGGDSFAVMESELEIDQAEFNRLGGSIKCAKVVGESDMGNQVDVLSDVLFSHYKDIKLEYGLSVYSFSEKQLRPILLKLKKKLQADGVKSRFINNDFKNISAAQYKSIKEKGIEIIVAKTNQAFLIGEVVGVQDIDAYSERDFDKPFRDMEMGMLPPKLAQILINLTGVSGKIWDPFCGSGTLVMEGLLMGRDMIGSDIDSDRVDGAKKNVEWLGQKAEAELFTHDATKPFKSDYEAIAFEGDLGIPHNQHINSDKLNQIISDLDDLYVKFFENLKNMEFGGPIVAGLPFFRLRNGDEVDMSKTVEKIESLGFKSTALLRDKYVLKYSRENQAVGRAIYRFQMS